MQKPLLRIVSSQLKYIPNTDETTLSSYEISSATFLKNEPFAFQILYRAPEGREFLPVSLQIDTASLSAKAYRVDYVPVSNAANYHHQVGFVADTPGLYPDVLMPRPVASRIAREGQIFCETDTGTLLNASGNDYRAQWVTINTLETAAAGMYPIRVTLVSLEDNAPLAEIVLSLEAIDSVLPPQETRYTNWFHVDCLCDAYHVQPYSDAFYALLRPMLQNAVSHRMNTLLLPAFTPALDTPIGSARRNVQLVDIETEGDGWRFDFSRLARFMHTVDECGIRFFEHCHLFSQWGANHAPNIYDKNGTLLFGWETDAQSAAYRAFIRAYLTALSGFLKQEGFTPDRLLIHISDEPSLAQIDGYRAAYESIRDLIEEYDQIDALFDVEFYKTGLLKTPVASIINADAFAAQVPNFWLYYTAGTHEGTAPGRLITHTAARTRVLGMQLYHYNAKGFLQWGYNFYYDRMSQGYFDPMHDPCGYKLMPGTPYLVYPAKDGFVPSLREELMREAMDDIRALRLLEQRIGRDEVNRMDEEYWGRTIRTNCIPEGNSMFTWRQHINELLRP